MKRLTTLFSLLLLSVFAVMAERHDWENNHVLQINREPARAWFFGYDKKVGDRTVSLNGQWQFRWAPTPDGIETAAWTTISVPANWEVNGFGTPIYSSSGYTFKVLPPYVMAEPKKDFTSYKERNPTGQYRRTFTLPSGWVGDGGRTFLRFDGVMSAFYVSINGKEVGYSQGSNHPSEFDITDYVNSANGDGKGNTIEMTVYKYSDGSYLEDQDAWRFGGIHRDVTIFHTPALHLRDFTVRTIAADSSYRNFHLQVNPRLQTHDGSDAQGYTIRAVLMDAKGNEVTSMACDAETTLNLNHKAGVMNEWYPQRGRMKFERMDTVVTDVHPWTAETPYLYTLRLALVDAKGNTTETVEQKVGFRQLEIKNGMMLVNGKQIRLRGVNRVEHDPLTAKYLSKERMLQDILLMKEANINAVRTAHAPASPLWYDLCDSLGLYILDEADCENHGVRGEFTSTPDWSEAMMDRCIRLAERDKNHPSVVFWSLGNESGYGANHSAMAGWLHEFDPTRFVHYEGAQGKMENGEWKVVDPQCVDVIARFYPRVKQEYLNPGIAEGSDKERAENARWERLLELAEHHGIFKGGYMDGLVDNRPVMTSEYAHCMGNALGNFQEYWDEIYSNPRMLGGFIWDWVDQGIMSEELRVKSEESHPVSSSNNKSNSRSILITRYGGDFGDKPNLKAFCLNGVVKCDRSLTTKYREVQHVYSPVQFARHGNDIYVINRNHHTTLADYTVTAQQVRNGKAAKPYTIALPEVMPGDSAIINIGNVNTAGHTLVNLTVSRNGKTVSDEQFVLAGSALDYVKGTAKQANKGTRVQSVVNEYTPLFFRAPVDNDKSFGNWVAKDWTKNRVDSPSVRHISTREEGNTTIKTDEYRFDNGIVKMEGRIIVETRSTSMADGSMDVVMDFTCEGEMPELPRLGMMIELPKDYEQLEYYGRGPWDTFVDRWRSCHYGLWRSTVSNEYAHYPVPQDCGNHMETSSVRLKTKAGKGITVTAVRDAEADNNGLFSFSALHFTPQEIASVRHDYELPTTNHTILAIDAATLGIGNSSCGPGVLKKYSIDKTRKHRLHVNIK